MLAFVLFPRERGKLFSHKAIVLRDVVLLMQDVLYRGAKQNSTIAVAAVMREFKTSASAFIVPTLQQTNATG